MTRSRNVSARDGTWAGKETSIAPGGGTGYSDLSLLLSEPPLTNGGKYYLGPGECCQPTIVSDRKFPKGIGRSLITCIAASVVPGMALGQTLAAEPSVPTRAPTVTAFVHVAVIPMDRERVLEDQTVLVEGDRITAMSSARHAHVPAGATQVNGRGRFLIPGLADMHMHLPFQRDSTAKSTRLLASYLAAGITTVRNLHGEPVHVSLRDSVVRGELLGPRIYTAGPYPTVADIANPAAIARFVAGQKAAGYDFIKIHHITLGDGAAELTGERFDSLMAAANRAGVRVATDLGYEDPARWVDVERQLRDHVGSIEHLTTYLYASQYRPGSGAAPPPDAARMRALAEATRRAGTWVVPTETVVRFGYPAAPSQEVRQDPERLAAYITYGRFLQARRQMIKALQDAGAGLLLGTDGDPIEVRRELELLVQAGLTPYQALVTGTRNVAAYFGTLDSTGTVAVGKRADLVLLRGNPLQDIHQVAQLAGVMIGGRWLPPDTLQVMAGGK